MMMTVSVGFERETRNEGGFGGGTHDLHGPREVQKANQPRYIHRQPKHPGGIRWKDKEEKTMYRFGGEEMHNTVRQVAGRDQAMVFQVAVKKEVQSRSMYCQDKSNQ